MAAVSYWFQNLMPGLTAPSNELNELLFYGRNTALFMECVLLVRVSANTRVNTSLVYVNFYAGF